MSYETVADVSGAGGVMLSDVLVFAGCVVLLMLLCCVCGAVGAGCSCGVMLAEVSVLSGCVM